MRPKQHPQKRALPAFSLVETVLALGIMGLAITALLGLLPHGIEMTRQAANMSAVSRIISGLASELSLVPYPSLSTMAAIRLNYDDQGTKLISSDARDFVAYVAEVVVRPTGAVLPGSSIPQSMIVPAVINVAATPNPAFAFAAQPASSYVTVPVILAPTTNQ